MFYQILAAARDALLFHPAVHSLECHSGGFTIEVPGREYTVSLADANDVVEEDDEEGGIDLAKSEKYAQEPPTLADHFDVLGVCLAAMRAKPDPRVPLAVLLHEAEAAVYGDVPGPVKLDEQRAAEHHCRARFFDLHQLPDLHAVWPEVEHFDKVEQAASVQIVGLAEPVHAQVWAACSPEEQARAVRAVRVVYEMYPPAAQLEEDAPLARRFQKLYDELRIAVESSGW